MGGNGLELSSAVFKLLTLFLMYHVKCAKSKEQFCEVSLFKRNTTSLEFTTEVNEFDYALVERYKSLPCCAKGYKTIEW
jgi:hypothetical protein